MFKHTLSFIVHTTVLAIVAVVIAFITPGQENASCAFAAIIVGASFAGFATLLMSKAIDRAAALADAVSVELNKLRRIHHLARAFSRAEKQIPWFDLVREAIESYLHAFEVIPFKQYDDTNEMFRRITQQLYGFDTIASEKGKLLFAELMTISGQATEARQRIHAMRVQRMGTWNAGVLLTLGGAVIMLTTVGFADSLGGRLAAALIALAVLVVVEAVFIADGQRRIDGKYYTKQYVDNIERMGFWPEEKM